MTAGQLCSPLASQATPSPARSSANLVSRGIFCRPKEMEKWEQQTSCATDLLVPIPQSGKKETTALLK